MSIQAQINAHIHYNKLLNKVKNIDFERLENFVEILAHDEIITNDEYTKLYEIALNRYREGV